MKLMETGSDLKIVHIKRGSNRWANILKIFKQARNTYRFCFTLQKTNKYNYYSKSQWRPKHMFSRVSKESSIGSMPGRFVNLNESTRLPRLAQWPSYGNNNWKIAKMRIPSFPWSHPSLHGLTLTPISLCNLLSIGNASKNQVHGPHEILFTYGDPQSYPCCFPKI